MDKNTPLTYLALGDSYTIGESVIEDQRWPVKLVRSLNSSSKIIENPLIIARTGWTTDELIKGISDADIAGQTFDFVSLLIGVNNQYRGYDSNIYRAEFEALLDQAIAFADGNSAKVFVLSIPDWGVTPFGISRNVDQDQVSMEIDQYNSIKAEICLSKSVQYFDITDISREAPSDPNLIANDGLHPSGEMYGRWVERVLPWIEDKIKDR